MPKRSARPGRLAAKMIGLGLRTATRNAKLARRNHTQMIKLGQTFAKLGQYRRRWEAMAKAAGALTPTPVEAPDVPSRLTEVFDFGSNPGALRMFVYVPPGLAVGRPLVVVLHGCLQSAASYDLGAAWSHLADRYGFAVLFPQQDAANNPKRCFNWFLRSDVRRGRGEALSIRQMIERMLRQHRIDRRRVFVTGLSAGGAMANVMLATYPETFAGGAIIAGLPYGTATNVSEALESMFKVRPRPAAEWGDIVRRASSHDGAWPRISVWHGAADDVVRPGNADEIVKQWTDVHGLAAQPSAEDVVDGYPRRVWRDRAGADVIESYTLPGMAHGTPLASGGPDALGTPGPFMLDVGIASSYHIAKFFGLTQPGARSEAESAAAPRPGGRPTETFAGLLRRAGWLR